MPKRLLQYDKDGNLIHYDVKDLIEAFNNTKNITGVIDQSSAAYPELSASINQIDKTEFSDLPNIKILNAIKELSEENPAEFAAELSDKFHKALITANLLNTDPRYEDADPLVQLLAVKLKLIESKILVIYSYLDNYKKEKLNDIDPSTFKELIATIIYVESGRSKKQELDRFNGISTEIITELSEYIAEKANFANNYADTLDEVLDILPENEQFLGLGADKRELINNPIILKALAGSGLKKPVPAELMSLTKDSSVTLAESYAKFILDHPKAKEDKTYFLNSLIEIDSSLIEKLEQIYKEHPAASISISDNSEIFVKCPNGPNPEIAMPVAIPDKESIFDDKTHSLISKNNTLLQETVAELTKAVIYEHGIDNKNITAITVPVDIPNNYFASEQKKMILEICTNLRKKKSEQNIENREILQKFFFIPKKLQETGNVKEQNFIVNINNGSGHFVSCLIFCDDKGVWQAQYKDSLKNSNGLKNDESQKNSTFNLRIHPLITEIVKSLSGEAKPEINLSYPLPTKQQRNDIDCGLWSARNNIYLATKRTNSEAIDIGKLSEDTVLANNSNIRVRTLAAVPQYSLSCKFDSELEKKVNERRTIVEKYISKNNNSTKEERDRSEIKSTDSIEKDLPKAKKPPRRGSRPDSSEEKTLPQESEKQGIQEISTTITSPDTVLESSPPRLDDSSNKKTSGKPKIPRREDSSENQDHGDISGKSGKPKIPRREESSENQGPGDISGKSGKPKITRREESSENQGPGDISGKKPKAPRLTDKTSKPKIPRREESYEDSEKANANARMSSEKKPPGRREDPGDIYGEKPKAPRLTDNTSKPKITRREESGKKPKAPRLYTTTEDESSQIETSTGAVEQTYPPRSDYGRKKKPIPIRFAESSKSSGQLSELDNEEKDQDQEYKDTSSKKKFKTKPKPPRLDRSMEDLHPDTDTDQLHDQPSEREALINIKQAAEELKSTFDLELESESKIDYESEPLLENTHNIAQIEKIISSCEYILSGKEKVEQIKQIKGTIEEIKAKIPQTDNNKRLLETMYQNTSEASSIINDNSVSSKDVEKIATEKNKFGVVKFMQKLARNIFSGRKKADVKISTPSKDDKNKKKHPKASVTPSKPHKNKQKIFSGASQTFLSQNKMGDITPIEARERIDSMRVVRPQPIISGKESSPEIADNAMGNGDDELNRTIVQATKNKPQPERVDKKEQHLQEMALAVIAKLMESPLNPGISQASKKSKSKNKHQPPNAQDAATLETDQNMSLVDIYGSNDDTTLRMETMLQEYINSQTGRSKVDELIQEVINDPSMKGEYSSTADLGQQLVEEIKTILAEPSHAEPHENDEVEENLAEEDKTKHTTSHEKISLGKEDRNRQSGEKPLSGKKHENTPEQNRNFTEIFGYLAVPFGFVALPFVKLYDTYKKNTEKSVQQEQYENDSFTSHDENTGYDISHVESSGPTSLNIEEEADYEESLDKVGAPIAQLDIKADGNSPDKEISTDQGNVAAGTNEKSEARQQTEHEGTDKHDPAIPKSGGSSIATLTEKTNTIGDDTSEVPIINDSVLEVTISSKIKKIPQPKAEGKEAPNIKKLALAVIAKLMESPLGPGISQASKKSKSKNRHQPPDAQDPAMPETDENMSFANIYGSNDDTALQMETMLREYINSQPGRSKVDEIIQNVIDEDPSMKGEYIATADLRKELVEQIETILAEPSHAESHENDEVEENLAEEVQTRYAVNHTPSPSDKKPDEKISSGKEYGNTKPDEETSSGKKHENTTEQQGNRSKIFGYLAVPFKILALPLALPLAGINYINNRSREKTVQHEEHKNDSITSHDENTGYDIRDVESSGPTSLNSKEEADYEKSPHKASNTNTQQGTEISKNSVSAEGNSPDKEIRTDQGNVAASTTEKSETRQQTEHEGTDKHDPAITKSGESSITPLKDKTNTSGDDTSQIPIINDSEFSRSKIKNKQQSKLVEQSESRIKKQASYENIYETRISENSTKSSESQSFQVLRNFLGMFTLPFKFSKSGEKVHTESVSSGDDIDNYPEQHNIYRIKDEFYQENVDREALRNMIDISTAAKNNIGKSDIHLMAELDDIEAKNKKEFTTLDIQESEFLDKLKVQLDVQKIDRMPVNEKNRIISYLYDKTTIIARLFKKISDPATKVNSKGECCRVLIHEIEDLAHNDQQDLLRNPDFLKDLYGDAPPPETSRQRKTDLTEYLAKLKKDLAVDTSKSEEDEVCLMTTLGYTPAELKNKIEEKTPKYENINAQKKIIEVTQRIVSQHLETNNYFELVSYVKDLQNKSRLSSSHGILFNIANITIKETLVAAQMNNLSDKILSGIEITELSQILYLDLSKKGHHDVIPTILDKLAIREIKVPLEAILEISEAAKADVITFCKNQLDLNVQQKITDKEHRLILINILSKLCKGKDVSDTVQDIYFSRLVNDLEYKGFQTPEFISYRQELITLLNNDIPEQNKTPAQITLIAKKQNEILKVLKPKIAEATSTDPLAALGLSVDAYVTIKEISKEISDESQHQQEADSPLDEIKSESSGSESINTNIDPNAQTTSAPSKTNVANNIATGIATVATAPFVLLAAPIVAITNLFNNNEKKPDQAYDQEQAHENNSATQDRDRELEEQARREGNSSTSSLAGQEELESKRNREQTAGGDRIITSNMNIDDASIPQDTSSTSSSNILEITADASQEKDTSKTSLLQRVFPFLYKKSRVSPSDNRYSDEGYAIGSDKTLDSRGNIDQDRGESPNTNAGLMSPTKAAAPNTGVTNTGVTDTGVRNTDVTNRNVEELRLSDESVIGSSVAGTGFSNKSPANTSVTNTSVTDTNVADTNVAGATDQSHISEAKGNALDKNKDKIQPETLDIKNIPDNQKRSDLRDFFTMDVQGAKYQTKWKDKFENGDKINYPSLFCYRICEEYKGQEQHKDLYIKLGELFRTNFTRNNKTFSGVADGDISKGFRDFCREILLAEQADAQENLFSNKDVINVINETYKNLTGKDDNYIENLEDLINKIPSDEEVERGLKARGIDLSVEVSSTTSDENKDQIIAMVETIKPPIPTLSEEVQQAFESKDKEFYSKKIAEIQRLHDVNSDKYKEKIASLNAEILQLYTNDNKELQQISDRLGLYSPFIDFNFLSKAGFLSEVINNTGDGEEDIIKYKIINAGNLIAISKNIFARKLNAESTQLSEEQSDKEVFYQALSEEQSDEEVFYQLWNAIHLSEGDIVNTIDWENLHIEIELDQSDYARNDPHEIESEQSDGEREYRNYEIESEQSDGEREYPNNETELGQSYDENIDWKKRARKKGKDETSLLNSVLSFLFGNKNEKISPEIDYDLISNASISDDGQPGDEYGGIELKDFRGHHRNYSSDSDSDSSYSDSTHTDDSFITDMYSSLNENTKATVPLTFAHGGHIAPDPKLFPPPAPNTFLNAVLHAPTPVIKLRRRESLDRLLEISKRDADTIINEYKETTRKNDYENRFNENKITNKISYVSVAEDSEQMEKDISYMAAKSASSMQLDPIVIYGGTYEEQTIAIRSALTQGFTAITVKPPNKGTRSAEYEKLIELVEYLKHDYQKHADCLDEISYVSGKNPRDIMYKGIKSELTRKDHVLEYQNDVQLGDCVSKMSSVRK